MVEYRLKIQITAEISVELWQTMENSLFAIICNLNSKYDEKCDLKSDADDDFYVLTSNSAWANDFLTESRNYLVAHGIIYEVNISVAMVINYITEETDAINVLSSMVNMKPGLSRGTYYVVDFSYMYSVDELIYTVCFKINSFKEMIVIMAISLIEDYEKEKIPSIIELLNNELSSIQTAIK